jgi:hypothetical protein
METRKMIMVTPALRLFILVGTLLVRPANIVDPDNTPACITFVLRPQVSWYRDSHCIKVVQMYHCMQEKSSQISRSE